MKTMNEKEMREAVDKISSDDERMTKLLTLMFDWIARKEMRLLAARLPDYRQMLAACIFEQNIRVVPLDISKLPYAIDLGWLSYKTCPTTMSKEERN